MLAFCGSPCPTTRVYRRNFNMNTFLHAIRRRANTLCRVFVMPIHVSHECWDEDHPTAFSRRSPQPPKCIGFWKAHARHVIITHDPHGAAIMGVSPHGLGDPHSPTHYGIAQRPPAIIWSNQGGRPPWVNSTFDDPDFPTIPVEVHPYSNSP